MIQRNIEIYNVNDEESFSKLINNKKSDLIVIDYCMVKKSLDNFLDYYFYKINYKINLIFGISKSDIQAFKTVPISLDNYKIIGLFLRSYSSLQISDYLISSIKRINIKIDERRKNIRVDIKDYNRCFAFIVEKGIGISCRILNISLGSIRAQIDNISFIQNFTPGKNLKLIHLYIKSFHNNSIRENNLFK